MPTATPSPHHDSGSTLERHTDVIRVASVPASHAYIRHLSPLREHPGLPKVVRLPDPDPRHPGQSTASAWWPPVMLDADWLRDHLDDFDVLHVHFGFDASTPAQLEDVVKTLREGGKPYVHTVHDLRNPHHRTSDEHDAQLDVLVPAADELITLTPGAAAEIHRRWGRAARVLPHPHVVDLATMERVRRRRLTPDHRDQPFRVGVHVKSLRASMDPLAILPVLVRAVEAIPGAVLQVNGHRDVIEPGGDRYDAVLADALRDAPGCVDVRVHDFFSEAQLWDYLANLDVSVLPYRFGTHSGWLEACRDLGTAVVAPSCGYYAEQGPVIGYDMDEDHLDAESLVEAIGRAYDESPVSPVSVGERTAQRQQLAAAHAELYRELLG